MFRIEDHEVSTKAAVGLLAALDIRSGERLALVGGGGKTGLAYRLVDEARRRGWTVLFSTTTRVLSPEQGEYAFVVGVSDFAALRQRLHGSGYLLAAREWLDEWEETPTGRQRKVAGFAPGELDVLVNNLKPDLAIVEADGSRHRPLKAPASHEPAVPPATTLLLALAGLSVLGQPLAEYAVHRPERVAELTAVAQGQPVDAALIAAVLAHPEGGLKGCPPQARAAAVLTQATAGRMPAGREVARRLLHTGRFERVVLADLDDPAAAGEVWCRATAGEVEVQSVPRVQAVVLAAGRSSRMGQNKLLLPLGGKPLVAHAVDAALGAPVAGVCVVLGAEAEEVRRCLGSRPVRFLVNDDWAEGQSTSLRAAVAELPAWSQGVLFLAGDMPFVVADHLEQLIRRLRSEVALVWSGYPDGRGIPALFGRATFAALRQLTGDRGGRVLAGLFSEEVVAAPFQPLDVDTVEQYEEACRWLERKPAGAGRHRPTPGSPGANAR